MAEFRWITMSLFLILELQITAVIGQYSSIIVRDGDDATLPCENVTANQDKCDNTNWIFSSSGNIVDLVQRGQIHENTEVKSDRLSVTADCSLVIKKVTREDVGAYHCQQHISGQDAQVVLSVINMNKHEDGEQVTLSCSVSTHDPCRHTVKWLYEGNDVDEDHKDNNTSRYNCSVTVRFPTSHLKLKSTYHEIFQCKVNDGYTREEQLFTFSPQSSGWWRFIIVSVGLTSLIIIVVAVNIWTRIEGHKKHMDDNAVHHVEDGDEGSVTYENIRDSSASVRLH